MKEFLANGTAIDFAQHICCAAVRRERIKFCRPPKPKLSRAAIKNATLRFIRFPSSIYYRNNVFWCCLTLQKKCATVFVCVYVQVCFSFQDMYARPYSWPSIIEPSFSSLSSSSLVVGESASSLGAPPVARALPQPLTRMCLCIFVSNCLKRGGKYNFSKQTVPLMRPFSKSSSRSAHMGMVSRQDGSACDA